MKFEPPDVGCHGKFSRGKFISDPDLLAFAKCEQDFNKSVLIATRFFAFLVG
jgi:hypothetical protein